jgi:hypothetical protein
VSPLIGRDPKLQVPLKYGRRKTVIAVIICVLPIFNDCSSIVIPSVAIVVSCYRVDLKMTSINVTKRYL